MASDGSPLDGWVAFMAACLCRQGVARMREDATRSTQQLTPGSPIRGPATFLEGLSALLQGDHEVADPLLAAGAELCVRTGNPATAAAALAERGVIALDRGDRAAALGLSEAAVSVVQEGHVEVSVQAAVVCVRSQDGGAGRRRASGPCVRCRERTVAASLRALCPMVGPVPRPDGARLPRP